MKYRLLSFLFLFFASATSIKGMGPDNSRSRSSSALSKKIQELRPTKKTASQSENNLLDLIHDRKAANPTQKIETEEQYTQNPKRKKTFFHNLLHLHNDQNKLCPEVIVTHNPLCRKSILDAQNVTELFKAIKNNDHEKVEMMLEYTDCNVQDQEGNTAFMQALNNLQDHRNKPREENAINILKYLNYRGSLDVIHTNNKNISALDLAQKYNMPQVERMLSFAIDCTIAAKKTQSYAQEEEMKKLYEIQLQSQTKN